MELYMNIDDVIKALKNGEYLTNREQKQLAEWLEELRKYKEKPEGYLWDEAVQQGYNKAIDDFADKAIKIVYEANNRDRNPQPRDMVADIHYKFIELAEQLKVGGENGTDNQQ